MYTYGVDGLTQPVDDLIDMIGRDRFIPAALDGITVDGKIYTVPQTGFPFFIYYRKDLYDGARASRPPETHEQLLENIVAVHNPPDVYGCIVTNQAISDTWNLKSAMWTHGAYFFDENDELALDRPETLQAWQFYKDLAKFSPPGSMAQSDLESRQLYVDGKVAHMLTTTSMSANFTADAPAPLRWLPVPAQAGRQGCVARLSGQHHSDQGEVARHRQAGDRIPARSGQLPGVPGADGRRLGADAPGRLHRRIPQRPADRADPGVHRARAANRSSPASSAPATGVRAPRIRRSRRATSRSRSATASSSTTSRPRRSWHSPSRRSRPLSADRDPGV